MGAVAPQVETVDHDRRSSAAGPAHRQHRDHDIGHPAVLGERPSVADQGHRQPVLPEQTGERIAAQRRPVGQPPGRPGVHLLGPQAALPDIAAEPLPALRADPQVAVGRAHADQAGVAGHQQIGPRGERHAEAAGRDRRQAPEPPARSPQA
ncbi:hypothetical protein CKO28_13940 [Rhodovibrio sodomensis]|uniref:Uncharacterized protein n=1 Tax=Rhodovibrio sodomensis TaxID=1088 RepID=A0ABS1DF82_9PROT|nr:hypothetical protein [Rhodovibrio sodomensis]